MLRVRKKQLPDLVATGVTTISFGQMHFSPVNLKQQQPERWTTTTRTTKTNEQKQFPVLSNAKRIGYSDSSLQDTWGRHTWHELFWKFVVLLLKSGSEGRSEAFQVLPSIFIDSQDFAQKTLWGLEQQQKHHCFSRFKFQKQIVKKKKYNSWF